MPALDKLELIQIVREVNEYQQHYHAARRSMHEAQDRLAKVVGGERHDAYDQALEIIGRLVAGVL